MPKVDLPPTNAALLILRILCRLTQDEFGELTGMKSRIVEIENGRYVLKRAELEDLVEELKVSAYAVPVALGLSELVLPSTDKTPHPWEATPDARFQAERATLESSAIVRRLFLAEARAERYAADREEAERLWKLLAPLNRDRRRVMARIVDFSTWAVVERLCIESLRGAPRDPGAARSLAELAVEVAQRIPPLPRFSDRVEGYAQAHLGNAFRVGNDFDEAVRAFALVAKLWIEFLPGEACPFDVTLIPDLEASLRRDQRQFSLAFAGHDRALSFAVEDAIRGRILLNKAVTFEHSGDPVGAVATLSAAQPLIDTSNETRLGCVARFNLAVNLLHLGNALDAEPLIAEVRALAIEQRNELDLIRVLWLSGRLAAAQGDRAKAMVSIDDAACRFAEQGLGYDAALAVLDLAGLLLEEGNPREAARRVAEVQPTFHVRNIHREELASLVLFLQAVETEAATAALARAAAEAWRLFGTPVPFGSLAD
ncbi:MAG: hypothetical protein ABJC13_14675 [Acidobacteriota bacterium]